MTTLSTRLVVAAFAGLILLLGPLPGAMPALAQQQDSIGRVVALTGAVNVVRNGVARTMSPDDPVYRSDLVVTGAKSRVRIALGKRATLTVGPRAQVEISQYYVRPKDGMFRGVLSLIAGIVRVAFSADDPDRAFEVRTRTAVASVRSTEWIVDLKVAGTGVLALDGHVTVRGVAGGEVVLAPGEGTDVAPGSPPTAPKRWGAARADDAKARTRLP